MDVYLKYGPLVNSSTSIDAIAKKLDFTALIIQKVLVKRPLITIT